MMPAREPSQPAELSQRVGKKAQRTLEHAIDLVKTWRRVSSRVRSSKRGGEQLTLVQATSVVTLTWQPPCALQVKMLLVLTEKSLPLGTSGVRVVVSLAM